MDAVLGKAMQELTFLLDEARRRGVPEATAAALATADPDGRPSVRTVYIQSAEPEGLLFWTNEKSGKGRQLEQNPQVSICFFWPQLQYQVVIDGTVEMLSEERSDSLWQNRSRESQLGAWASEQSEPVQNPSDLQAKLKQLKKDFDFTAAPRPPAWRAYQVHPEQIAFWPSGWHRMRAKEIYRRNADGSWSQGAASP